MDDETWCFQYEPLKIKPLNKVRHYFGHPEDFDWDHLDYLKGTFNGVF